MGVTSFFTFPVAAAFILGNRRARFYKLTPRGRKRIAVEVSNWRRVVEAINQLVDPQVP
jgi:DNA-binding MarR family transcriptional regulator